MHIPFRIPIRIVPGWKRPLLILAPLTLAIVGVAAAYAYSTTRAAGPPPSPITNPVLDMPTQPGLLVDVSGAVENPGLYRLPRGDRVFDAIAAAGGLSPDADMSKLPNL